MPQPPAFYSAAKVKKEIDEYFAECDRKEEPYTVTGLALALGTNIVRLKVWVDELDKYYEEVNAGIRADDDVPYSDVDEYLDIVELIIQAKAKCEHNVLIGTMKGKINPAAGIFTLKVGHNWHEQNNLNITSKGESIKPTNIQIIMPEEQAKRITGVISDVAIELEGNEEKITKLPYEQTNE
jgi:hypothetical protein